MCIPMDLKDKLKGTIPTKKLEIGITTDDMPNRNQTFDHERLNASKQQRGFTLVEILVVMLIIGITFGMAMLAFGDFGATRKIRSSAEGFAQFLQVMHERALLESTTVQIHLNPSGYTSQRLNVQSKWQPLKNAYYRPRSLPPKTKISVAYGGKKPDQLVITMSSSGDMTPFKVYFGSAEQPHLASIIGTENGTVNFNDTDTR